MVRSKKTLNKRLREAATIPAARSTQVEPPTRSRSQSRSRASSPALSINPLSADEQTLAFLGRQLGRARSADSNSPPHLPEDFPADNMDLYEDPSQLGSPMGALSMSESPLSSLGASPSPPSGFPSPVHLPRSSATAPSSPSGRPSISAEHASPPVSARHSRVSSMASLGSAMSLDSVSSAGESSLLGGLGRFRSGSYFSTATRQNSRQGRSAFRDETPEVWQDALKYHTQPSTFRQGTPLRGHRRNTSSLSLILGRIPERPRASPVHPSPQTPIGPTCQTETPHRLPTSAASSVGSARQPPPEDPVSEDIPLDRRGRPLGFFYYPSEHHWHGPGDSPRRQSDVQRPGLSEESPTRRVADRRGRGGRGRGS